MITIKPSEGKRWDWMIATINSWVSKVVGSVKAPLSGIAPEIVSKKEPKAPKAAKAKPKKAYKAKKRK